MLTTWLPTRNLGHSKRKQLSEGDLARCERAKRRRDDQKYAEEIDDLFQQQMESILLNEVEYIIKEEIRDISSELFVLEIATECVMEEVLLETTMCMEKEIVQEEWEMAVVDYAESKFNYTSKVTDLQKELTDCRTKGTIANVRIHIECVIGNVRQKYSILQNTLPIHFVHKRDGEDTPLYVDRIVHVCCALVNVYDSVVNLLLPNLIATSFYLVSII